MITQNARIARSSSLRSFIRLLAISLLIAVIFLCGCGSGHTETNDTTASGETTAPETAPPPILLVGEGAPTYTVIRPDEADALTKQAAVLIFNELTKYDAKSNITTDWEGNPVSDYEIVVGETTRFSLDGLGKSQTTFGEEGYFIRVIGSRIYVCGGSPEATKAAAEYFIDTFFGEEKKTSVELAGDYLYTVTQTYPITDVTVGGHSLREFVLSWDESLSEAEAAKIAEEVTLRLFNATGIMIPTEAKPAADSPILRLSAKASGTDGDFTMSLDGKNLVLATDTEGGHTRGIAQFIYEQLRGKAGDIDLGANFKYSFAVGKCVTYSQFGALGDGKTDDMAAIIATHAYANTHNLAVRADVGATYYIGNTATGAIVMTDTDWTGASFILDDTKVDNTTRSIGIFNVRSSKATYRLTDSIQSLKRDQTKLNLTLNDPAVMILTDSSTKRYIRAGGNANSGADQTDIIVVDRNGNLDPNAPLLWDYEQITSIQVLPIDEKTLTIRGGHFTTIANQLPSSTNYFNRGLIVQRSNVVIEGLKHEVTGEGKTGCPYQGILVIRNCANVTVRDCVFTAHKFYYSMGSGGSAIAVGTYDISPSSVVNLTFEGCTQTTDILDDDFWGIMGSNYCKNMVFRNCTLSRVDAHQGVANLTILDSKIGYAGLTVIGRGMLRIENSTLHGKHFIDFRSDYGSSWEGDAVIRNCTWVPQYGKRLSDPVSIFGGSNSANHDFGYPCYMPANITIDGLHIDDKNVGSTYRGAYIFANFTSGNTNANFKPKYPYHVPETLTIRSLTTASGKDWRLSPNSYMFREVKIVRE